MQYTELVNFNSIELKHKERKESKKDKKIKRYCEEI